MPKQTVKLVSAEGFEFIVDYKAACVSNTIRNMLSSQGKAGRDGSAGPRWAVEHNAPQQGPVEDAILAIE